MSEVPPADRFVRGYFVHHGPVEQVALSGWTLAPFGGFVFGFHPRTEWAACQDPESGKWIVLIGLPLDIENAESSITRLAQDALRILLSGGREPFVRHVAYWGGRFVCVFGSADTLELVPDCHATLSAYWARTPGGGMVASSHSRLTAELIGGTEDLRSLSIMTSPQYSDGGGRYYPGMLTPYEGVHPLIANCLVRYDSQRGEPRLERFYPWTAIQATAPPEVSLFSFARQLESHLDLMATLGPTHISLTAGLDSNTVLKAARGRLAPGSLSYTYFRFENAVPETVSDLLGASEAARAAGVPHRILRVHQYDASDPWMKFYAGTFPRGARFPSLAKTYAQSFDPADISLISLIAETGTVFYRERDDPNLTPRRLARKYTYAPIRDSDVLAEVFAEYIAATDFALESIGNIDYHDLFYWEHRNPKWASLWYSEIDLSHRVLLPFNSRHLIETMLSLPYELRSSRYLLNAYLSSPSAGRTLTAHSYREVSES